MTGTGWVGMKSGKPKTRLTFPACMSCIVTACSAYPLRLVYWQTLRSCCSGLRFAGTTCPASLGLCLVSGRFILRTQWQPVNEWRLWSEGAEPVALPHNWVVQTIAPV
jgi:hypothetical protein